MDRKEHDRVYDEIQGTIDVYFSAIEDSSSRTDKMYFKEKIANLVGYWESLCQDLDFVSGYRLRTIPKRKKSVPEPKPVRNLRREAILAQRARKVA